MIAALLAFAAAGLGCAALGTLAGGRPLRAARGGPRALLAFARLGGRLRAGRARAPRDLAARIEAAGSPGGLGVREAMAAKVALAFAAVPPAALAAAAAPGRLGPLVAVAWPVGGFLAPDAWLARRAAERGRRARRELPELLDLLRVTIEAGVAPAAALAAVGARAGGPLAAEWRAAARQAELGVPLSDALAGMARRLPLPEVQALASAVTRSLGHGEPLAGVLAAQARDARLTGRRRIQEDAARAGPKIQLVVALLLVPSVLLLVAAALAGALLGGAEQPVELR